MSNENFAAAIQALERAYSLEPSPETFYRLFHCLREAGQFERARVLCDEFAAARPGDAMAWTYKGNLFLEAKKFDDALSCLQRAYEIDKKSYAAMASIGAIYASRGAYVSAIAMLEASLRIKPDYEPAKHNLLFAQVKQMVAIAVQETGMPEAEVKRQIESRLKKQGIHISLEFDSVHEINPFRGDSPS